MITTLRARTKHTHTHTHTHTHARTHAHTHTHTHTHTASFSITHKHPHPFLALQWLHGYGIGIHLLGGGPKMAPVPINPRSEHLSFQADASIPQVTVSNRGIQKCTIKRIHAHTNIYRSRTHANTHQACNQVEMKASKIFINVKKEKSKLSNAYGPARHL